MRDDLIETFKIINGFVGYGHNMFRKKNLSNLSNLS